MGAHILLYTLIVASSFTYGVRINKSQKNLVIDTLNKKLTIRGDINTFGDIKRCLSEQHGRDAQKLFCNNESPEDHEPYSEEEHKKIYAVSTMRGGMNVSVKTMSGRTIQVQVSETDTVLELKTKLEDEQCIPVDQQRLIFDGKQLENNKTIAEYGIKENAVLHLVLRLRGG